MHISLIHTYIFFTFRFDLLEHKMDIKIGILLDACGIAYTGKQLSKLEDLIRTFIETQIRKHVEKTDLGCIDSVQDPIAIKKEENVFDDISETKEQIKSEETVFAEDINKYEKNVFVSEDSFSHEQIKSEETVFTIDIDNDDLISNDILGKSDVKLKVEENGSEPMHDLNLKEEIQSYEITQDNKYVCSLCKLPCESKILFDLHRKMTHDCELSFNQRKKFKWTCPCCSAKLSDTIIYRHVKSCEITLNKVNAGCLECGQKFNFKKLKGGIFMLSQHMLRMHKKECQICEESFESNEKFRDHMATLHKDTYCSFCCKYFSPEDLANHNTDMHICEICQKKVRYKSQHIKEYHIEKSNCCKYCDKTFSTDTKLQTHILEAHIKPLSCDLCDYKCGHQSQLNKHKDTHVKVNYTCEECSLTFTSNYRRKIHVLGIHEKKFDYECEKCNKKFCMRGQLKMHNSKLPNCNSKEKQIFCCEYCSKQFTTKNRMKIHIDRTHLNIKKFPCTECDKDFSGRDGLQEHLRIEHGDGIKKFLCDDCGKCFLTSNRLKIHTNNTHGSKKFECDICHKSFALQGKLKKHVNEVHGVPNEKCPQCDKCFINKHRVTVHIKNVHTRPHPCDKCEKGFGDIPSLEKHVRIVHGEKTHKCTLCSDMFPSTIQLKSHMENCHDMSRPFHCSKCSKTFNLKELLEHHVARAHEMRNCETCPHCSKQFSRLKAHLLTCSVKWSGKEKRKFECPNCDKIFTQKSTLNKHMKISCNTSELLVD